MRGKRKMSDWETEKMLVKAVTTIHKIEDFTLSHCAGCDAEDCLGCTYKFFRQIIDESGFSYNQECYGFKPNHKNNLKDGGKEE